MNNQTSNTVIALVLSFVVIAGWYVLFPPPEATLDTTAPLASDTAPAGEMADAAGITAPAGTATPDTGATAAPSIPAALADSARVEINTPDLTGTIALLFVAVPYTVYSTRGREARNTFGRQ